MSYDDVEIEDMEWNDDLGAYTYPCPCGDLFQITKVCLWTTSLLEKQLLQPEGTVKKFGLVQEELAAGEEIARCPSCSLYITVVYDPVSK